MLTSQEMIRGQVALRHIGVLGIPLFNVENACASASSAFHLGWMAVAAGMYDIVLAAGAEKMHTEDKTRAFRATAAAIDLEQFRGLKASDAVGLGGSASDPPNKSLFMDIYASATREYMKLSGATADTFADVAVKSHAFAALNLKAQHRERVTREQVLASRQISPPLTLLMCSPIGDGAAAAVIMSERLARKRAIQRPIAIRASVVLSGRDREAGEPSVANRAAKRAYESAGLGPLRYRRARSLRRGRARGADGIRRPRLLRSRTSARALQWVHILSA